MPQPWALAIGDSKASPNRLVAGLSTPLRLALAAQAGGAVAVLSNDSVAPCLDDDRLRIPVVTARQQQPDARWVVAPADLVTHRSYFVELARIDADRTGDRDLQHEPFSFDTPYGFDALRADSARSARQAERLLFRSLRKPQDGWTSRYLNRYISLAISRWLVKTPLTPNQVSVGILAIGLCGAWLASKGTYWPTVIGALLFHGQSVLDGCDGEMSRVTYRGSLMGEWLDTVGDDVTNYAFFGAAAIGLYRNSGQIIYAIAGAIAVGCGVLASAIEYRYLIRIGSGDLLKYPLSQSTNDGSGLMGAIGPLFKRDTFVFLTFLSAVAGLLGPMLLVFAIGAIGVLASVLATERRMARSGDA